MLGLSVITALSLYLACSGSKDSIYIPDAAPNVINNSVWKFGVMGDTQWLTTAAYDTANNPNSTCVQSIKQMNQQFINHGVDFVIQVGDLKDTSANGDHLITTSKYRQDLYNAGIGFFPVRGNHEADSTGFGTDDALKVNVTRFLEVFPQTRDGVMNNLPASVLNATDSAGSVSKTSQATFKVGDNFSSPTNAGGADYTGLSYSFTHKNATFVLLDQFPAKGVSHGVNDAIRHQQTWITDRLSNKPSGNHAFVMAHKGLVHENHTDVLFGSNPSTGAEYQTTFINSLYNNGVKYFQSGHDHMHSRSMFKAATGNAEVMQLTSASCSMKFYVPLATAPDAVQPPTNAYPGRQTMLQQHLYTMGYYIYTIDGNNVTVDYYTSQPMVNWADNHNAGYSDIADIFVVPQMTFAKADTWGYNLNGTQKLVQQNGAYNVVQDGKAKILSGISTYNKKDGEPGRAGNGTTVVNQRQMSHLVTTGWTPKTDGLLSDIFTIWGMANEVKSVQTDTYCLSMTYDVTQVSDDLARTGQVGIATRGDSTWVNAVSKNIGGATKFVEGAYNQSTHTLGTWGVDTSTKTFWAVINYNADFAIASKIL